MKKTSLKVQLMISFLAAGLIPMLTVGIYSYYIGAKGLREDVVLKLDAVKEIKQQSIKRYFNDSKNQLISMAHTVSIEDALMAFKDSFHNYVKQGEISEETIRQNKSKLKNYYLSQFGTKYQEENKEAINIDNLVNPLKNVEVILQYQYISNNIHPLGQKELLVKAEDKSNYSDIHHKYHPEITEFLNKFGYYDIFLVDFKTGHILYSVYKELDYATSLIDGPYSNSGIAKVFRLAQKIDNPDDFAVTDFEQYVPSYNAPAAFMATPIWVNNVKEGILIFQIPIGKINEVMSERAGMGKTGETYLVGPDKLLRSDSYLNLEKYNVVDSFKNSDERKVDSESITEALDGKSGTIVTTNYLNKKVISSFRQVDIIGMKWALIGEALTEEAYEVINNLRNALIIALILSAGIISFFSLSFASVLSKKINKIASKLLENASKVANSSDSMAYNSSQLSESSTESAASLQETVSSIDQISSMIQRNADAANNSTKTSEQSKEIVNKGKQTVESMIHSIDDISKSNNDIATEMHRNNEDISKIVNVISEIGEKTKIINDIVFQTKLLSFNASVEAARAGEHGKGFAVVAEEVGNLASMSGKAAQTITELLESSTQQVTSIVDNTKLKVEDLLATSKKKVENGTSKAKECGSVFDQIFKDASSVNQMVNEIATASNEQSSGVREVTKAMQQLDQTTHQNTSLAHESAKISKELKEQASLLNLAVNDLMMLISGNSKNEKKIDTQNNLTKTDLIKLEDDKTGSFTEIPASNIDDIQEKTLSSGPNIPDESDDRFEDL